jgi:hypothetical protein
MEPLVTSTDIRLWPLILGWILVCCLFLFAWRRQAILAFLGMTIVTVAVLKASLGA